MKRKVLGIDVSKETLDISIYDGNSHFHKTLSNKPSCLLKYLQKYSLESIHIVMEATGIYHLRIAMSVHEKGYNVSIVNPLIIKRYSEMKMSRVKTDKADAKIIAEFGYEQTPQTFNPASKERLTIIQLLKTLEDLHQTKSELNNRLEAYDCSIGSSSIARKSLISIVNKIDKEIKKLNKELDNFMDTNFPEIVSKLTQIPGVGPKTAATIIGYYGDFSDFETAKQAVSFAGLNPNPRQSGTSVHRGSNISKKGHSLIRKTLFMSALSGIRVNPEYKEYYQKMIVSGKAKKKALIAVANKLLRQIFAIIKYNRDWVLNYAFQERKLENISGT